MCITGCIRNDYLRIKRSPLVIYTIFFMQKTDCSVFIIFFFNSVSSVFFFYVFYLYYFIGKVVYKERLKVSLFIYNNNLLIVI